MRRIRLKACSLIAVLAVIALTKFGSDAYRRYLRCRALADDCVLTEGLCRQQALVCRELAPRLREVGTLAREIAKSASAEFERSRWLEMARLEEEKAAGLDREAAEKLTRAARLASRADRYYWASWRPWVDDPEFAEP